MSKGIYIPNMDAEEFDKLCAEKGLQFIFYSVPPHGRLIDADALIASLKDRKGNYYGYESAVKGEAVDAAPTVIEAECEDDC